MSSCNSQSEPIESERSPKKTGALLVVGTGIQWGGQTTLAAQRAIQRADRVLFAVADPWAARWIRTLNRNSESLPYPRDGRARRTIYREMTEKIVSVLQQGGNLCVAFYGSPALLARSAHSAIREARKAGYSAAMLPGVSSLDCLGADMGVDLGEQGVQIFEATDFLLRRRTIDVHAHLVLCQIALIGNAGTFDGDPRRIEYALRLLRNRLLETFPATHSAYLYEAPAHPASQTRIERITVHQLADASVREISTLCVPPLCEAPIDRHMAELLANLPSEADARPSESTSIL